MTTKTKTKNEVEDLTTGRMTARVESKIPDGLDREINTLATELAGGGDPRMFRSRAVRQLLVDGVLARRDRQPSGRAARR